AVSGEEARGRWSAQIVCNGFGHQFAQPEDRDALSGAAAAIHRSRGRKRADAVAGTRIDPDLNQRQRQRHDRARRRIDRAVLRHAADLAVGAALADGHRTGGARGKVGAGDEAGLARAQSSFASMPRFTAGRAISVSYQRLTCGKSESSTLWRGCRQAQPRIAKSATDSAPATNSRPSKRRSSTP